MARISLDKLAQRLKGDTLDKYKEVVAKSSQEWSRVAGEEAKLIIVETIQRGQSPVKGGVGQTGGKSRFYDYSRSYKSAIKNGRYSTLGKKLRPVNLTLTGTMLRSIKVRLIDGGFAVWFSSGIAKYHTLLGAGKSQIKRKMLPVDQGDEFTRLIFKGLVDKFNSILSRNLKG